MTAHNLLSAVLADPFDDLPRLAYADCLDENGEPERAEFIRTQIAGNETIAKKIWNDNRVNGGVNHFVPPYKGCRVTSNWLSSYDVPEISFPAKGEKAKVILRRGFPDEIRCTMNQWVGETCRYCNGGYIHNDMHHSPDTCSRCKGTGGAKGIAKQVCEQWPVTRVVFPEMEPVIVDGVSDEFSGRWIWWMGTYEAFDSNQRNELPGFLNPVWPHVWAFNSRKEAIAALSHAALNYGRRLAGLPEFNK